MNINKKVDDEKIVLYFKNYNSFTTDDVYKFYSKYNSSIKKTTVNWHIFQMIRKKIFQRIGRGRYTLGTESPFKIILSEKQKAISLALTKQFPFTIHCIWSSSIINEFSHHISFFNFLIVEVERESLESIFYFLKEINKNVFKAPMQDTMENFILDLENVVIVKTLISESPLQSIEGIYIPYLEKILVDLHAEREIFFFLESNELLNIFRNAFDKYTININRLLRYAKRRNKRKKISAILKQIKNH